MREAEKPAQEFEDIESIDVRLLLGGEATSTKVLMELIKGCDFLHYSGHAMFDTENPDESGLLLNDRLLKAYTLKRILSRHPPVLAFVNACESTQETSWG